ncbi:hypothetical protein ACTRT3_08935 [Streptococcus pneumoniae]|nr:hypothetical protein SP6UMMC_04057 [Streptococcus pneumoniae MNZ41]KGI27848.1 Fucolectin-related protein [Streptococcus pneumoniae]KGI34560.1 Fucolectin-like protein [Streptococcus pneumoniae ECC_3510]OYL09398.1 hypothetical protein AK86_00490 [Streptococcus pneumoniae B1599]KGI30331.1 Fucolectin-related protein [Streptococcus pneumoniae]
MLDSKEELKESENDAPKLETPLREEPRLAPQTLPEASEVLENKREESKVEITEPAQDSPILAPVEETKEEAVTEKPTNTRSLTAEDLVKISKGELHLENDLIDESFYGEKALDLEGDDDQDGIKNKDGKDYLGYNSHPLLADSDGDGLADGEDDNKKEWYVTDRDSLLFMELAYRDDDYIEKILDHKNLFPSLYLDRQEHKLMHNELAPF